MARRTHLRRTQKGKGHKRPRKMHRNGRSPGMKQAAKWLLRNP
jgi:hypothetical protein